MAGIGLGLAGALSTGRQLASLLYDVRPTDPLAFATVIALLLTVVLLACLVPALAATRVPPAEVLRAE